MIKDNQRILNQIHVVLDAVVTGLMYLFAWWFKFQSGLIDSGYALSKEYYFSALYIIIPVYLILYYQFVLYNSKRASGRKRELFNICKANIVGTIGFIVVLYMVNQPHFSREMIFFFGCFNVIMLTVERNFIRYVLRFFRKKGFNLKHILLIGYSRSAEMYINRIRMNPQWGYNIRGILDDIVEAGTM